LRPATPAPAGPALGPRPGPPVVRLAPQTDEPPEGMPASIEELVRSPGSGAPLAPEVAGPLARGFGVDPGPIRVHTDARSAAAAKALETRAFTVGTHIFLGAGERPNDLALLAHEVGHVVQQQGGPAVQLLGGASVDGFEREAQAAATAVTSGRPVRVRGRTGGARVQPLFGWIRRGLRAIRDRVLRFIRDHATDIPGYDLLAFILGKDPITQQRVERNAINLLRAVVGLLPGGRRLFDNLQQAGVIERAYQWFVTEVDKLDLSWAKIRGLFGQAWDALSASDLLDPLGAWRKIKAIFAPPFYRLVNFVRAIPGKILEFIFEGALALAGSLGRSVLAIFRRIGAVFGLIVRDPIGFLGNLVRAVKGGFQRFAARIGEHLRTAIFDWLLGAMRGAVTLPQRFDAMGILSLVLQVLGLTYPKMRERLVRLIGEPAVAFIEKAFDFLQTIVTKGLAAAWEKILEFATGLVDQVIEGIRSWVANSVIRAAIARLVLLFNPIGAIIQAIIGIYKTVVFFIEKARQIAALVNSIIDSIAEIASGNLTAAIAAVERTMARTLSVIISFLANYLSLGNAATYIRNIIQRVQTTVDNAINKVVQFIVDRVKGLFGGAEAGAGPAAVPGATFGEGEERHRVYVVVEGGRQRTMIATSPAPALERLAQLEKLIETDIPKDSGPRRDKANARALAKQVRERVGAFEAQPNAPPAGSQAYVSAVAALLAPLYRLVGHPNAPETVVVPRPSPGGQGLEVEAKPLTRKAPSDMKGQASTGAPIPSDARITALYKATGNWVKLHLLSFRLHGPDRSWNFTPGTQSANAAMAGIEAEVVGKLAQDDGRKIMHYLVRVQYRKDPSDSDFPESITVTYGEYDAAQGRPVNATTRRIPVAQPVGGVTYANMSTDGREVLQRVGGLPEDIARAIVAGRREVGVYRSIEDVVSGLISQPRVDPGRLVPVQDPAGRRARMDIVAFILARIEEGRLRLN
jgi:hypothetical protein